MNCKQGDLVVCVSGVIAEVIGRIFTVTSRCENFWRTNPTQRDRQGFIVIFNDETLRPIRDNDGEDEMLRTAGEPEKEQA